MKCVSTKVLVSVIKDEKKTNELGLTLPSTLETEGLSKAKVIYVGEEVKAEISEGSELYMYSGAGTSFTNPEDGEKYRVITAADIVVIF